MTPSTPAEGLQVLRFIMVLSSMAPLFVLWAIRGATPIPDVYFIPGCLIFAIIPTLILARRISTAKKTNDCQTKIVYRADDHRDRILVYLFAMLLPLFASSLQNQREFEATLLALVFILFLFWHLNMHYMNIIFAIQGYRVFTVAPNPQDKIGSGIPFVILTRRICLNEGDRLDAYRLSDTVFIEK